MLARSTKIALPLAALLGLCDAAAAFAPSSRSAAAGSSRRSRTGSDLLAVPDDDEDAPLLGAGRRGALRTLSLALASSVAAASAPQAADAAQSELFKPNPLTNPLLEQMRIMNQDEADNIKYGGELESGSAKPFFDQYVQLLQPILMVESDLTTIDKMLNEEKPSTKEEYTSLFKRVEAILAKSQFDKINFKKAFNAFADNIYYSDPDRANLYLGGGAVPKTTQSIAYLLRNDVLTNVEDMRAEVTYLLKEAGKRKDGEAMAAGEGGLELEDIFVMSKVARESMVKYLDLVPPKELEAARAKFTAQ